MNVSVRHGKPIRNDTVWLRQVGKENALYDPNTGSLHLLNDTALAIWHLCDGNTEPDEMVMAICQVSGLHPDIVGEDVRRILREFDQVGLLSWTG